MDEKEQMQRAVNDMRIRFPDVRDTVSNDFFSSRLDNSDPNGLNSYNIPLIADLLFCNGIYKRDQIAGLEVEADPLEGVVSYEKPAFLGYGARTFIKLKSPKGKILGHMRITFHYKAELLRFSSGHSTPNLISSDSSEQQNQKDNFLRLLDYLKIKYAGESAIYRIKPYEVEKIEPDSELVSQLQDEDDWHRSIEYYAMLKEQGANLNHVNRLPNPESVVNHFKKIWMLENEY